MDSTTVLICVLLALVVLNAVTMGRGLLRFMINLGSGLLALILIVYVAHVFWPGTIDGPCKWSTAKLQPTYPGTSTWLKETAVCQKET